MDLESRDNSILSCSTKALCTLSIDTHIATLSRKALQTFLNEVLFA